jgi:hypothetical protein
MNVDFDETADIGPHLFPYIAVGRDRRDDCDHSVSSEQITNEPNSTHVGVAILFAEAESFGQVRPDDVTIQQFDFGSGRLQAFKNPF